VRALIFARGIPHLYGNRSERLAGAMAQAVQRIVTRKRRGRALPFANPMLNVRCVRAAGPVGLAWSVVMLV
jgi:hypothetical protein